MMHENTIRQIQDLEKDGVPDVAASFYLNNQKQSQNVKLNLDGKYIDFFSVVFL